jgi:hypothetical protein
MKFYTVKDDNCEILDCFTSKKEALALIDKIGGVGTIDIEEIAVNADTIRRLLGNQGGFVVDMQRLNFGCEW